MWKKLENIYNSVHDMILIACIFTSTAEDIKTTTHALCARIIAALLHYIRNFQRRSHWRQILPAVVQTLSSPCSFCSYLQLTFREGHTSSSWFSYLSDKFWWQKNVFIWLAIVSLKTIKSTIVDPRWGLNIMVDL